MRSLTPARERKGLVLIMQEEIWKDVVGYEGYYQVSNLGNVRSIKYGKISNMYLRKHKYGYMTIRFSVNGIVRGYKIHRLVAEAFIPNPENKPHIDHINTIRTDNRVENLRWVTRTENANNPLTIEHIRIAVTGERNPFYGRKHSERSIQQIRDKRKGIPISESTKAKLSIAFSGDKNPMYGKTHTQEAKAKIREAQKRTQMRPVVQLTKDGCYIAEFDCMTDAARSVGCKTTCAIMDSCRKDNRYCKGYKWMYKEDYDNRNASKTKTAS